MTDSDSADPIAGLMAVHAVTRQHLQVIASGAGGAPALRQAIAWIEGPVRLERHILQQTLIPALIESMAGSDAVCIREMAAGLMAQGAALERRWAGSVAPALTESMLRAAAPDSRALAAWVTEFTHWQQRISQELLPMASRLLDEDALAALAAACQELTCGH